MGRGAIGNNPLDFMVGGTSAATKASRRGLEPAGTTPRPERPPRIVKDRLTVHVPVDLTDAVKDAVVALSGPPHRLTLAAFAEEALRRELDRLKASENKGKAFPKREGELKGGRPIRT